MLIQGKVHLYMYIYMYVYFHLYLQYRNDYKHYHSQLLSRIKGILTVIYINHIPRIINPSLPPQFNMCVHAYRKTFTQMFIGYLHIYTYIHMATCKQKTWLSNIIFLPMPSYKIAKIYTNQCYE